MIAQLQAPNAAVELYESLLRNPSILGRLIHIASYWDPETSRYDRGLPERYQKAGLNGPISRWHQAFFNEWLALSLTQQQHDVMAYLNGVGRTPEQIRKIRELGEASIPPLVEREERRTFLQNLSFVQTVLSHETKAAGSAA